MKIRNRAVVTGIGMITAVGLNKEESWKNIRDGKSGIHAIQSFDTSAYKTKTGGEIKEFRPETHFDAKQVKRLDRASQIVMVACKEAVEDAKLNVSELNLDRVGIALGTTLGGMVSGEKYHRELLKKGWQNVSSLMLLDYLAHNQGNHISKQYKLSGPNITVSNACASGGSAIGIAYDQIRFGKTDLVITGGYDTMCQFTFAGFNSLQVLTPTLCRPFDKNRSGLILGEGVGILVLEKLEHAKKRKANIYAEILGHGCSSDAYHLTQPDPQGKGAAKAIRFALEDAQIQPGDIDYINAHGTATPYNDRMETVAIKSVFGERAYKIPISSCKPIFGHLMGGAGAVESIVTILSITNKVSPPTMNHETPDPDCDLDYVPDVKREVNISTAMSNSFGFGGINNVVIFREGIPE